MDEQTRKEILEAIKAQGFIENDKIKLASEENLHNIVDYSSGLRKIRANKRKDFTLIISQPKELSKLYNVQIRCCFCHKVISYPAWYYRVGYNVNSIHYFVCFDSTEPSKPTARCANFGL